VEVAFLYTLSDFKGPISYHWPNIAVDQKRNEIYVVDTKEREVTVFNDYGMAVYRFADDGTLGTVVDLAVDEDGHILALSRQGLSFSIIVCNYRGEPLSQLTLENFPAELSNFTPKRMAYRQERLYLVDSKSMSIAVTDKNGFYLKGYDLGSILNIEEKKRNATDIDGFSVDHNGNILFTIPVLFAAYRLSPEGEIRGFGRPGGAPGKFNVVGGIVADDRGYYYVADRLKSAILVFDEDFKFQFEFGYRGPRRDNLSGPRHLALDSQDRLYVSQLNSRGVSVFKITHKP
jgi:DNA-binding beta-propeller fold protein YncE